MSCTVIAIPFALAHVIVALTTVATTAAVSVGQLEKQNNGFGIDDWGKNFSYKNEAECEDIHTISVSDVVEKVYETPFMDKEILLKTIQEHGICEITETFDGKITGKVDTFSLEFEQTSSDKPYTLKITCNKKDNSDEKVDDISSEYGANVQEAAYLSIVERLKENNMQIEDETVEEDNTIVLTINLE